jgi:hypothetical protein
MASTAQHTSQRIFASAQSYVAGTPSDSTQVTFSGIYVGVGGDIAITFNPNFSPVVFTAVPQGSILPVAVNNGYLNATGTTATNLVLMDW